MAFSIGGGGSGSDYTSRDYSQSSYSQKTPMAMELPEEYKFMLSQFIDEYFKGGKTLETTQKEQELEAAKASLSSIVGVAPTSSAHNRQQIAATGALQSKIASLEAWLASQPEPGTPRYQQEAEITARGIRDAAGAIPEYMRGKAGIIPDAYQAASDKYSGLIDSLTNQATTGGSFQEDLPEDLINRMLSGVSLGMGGQQLGSFAPKGAAEAVSNLYNTRAQERTKTLSLLDQLAQSQRDYSVVPAEMRYEAGLTPLLQELANAQQYPENLGWLSAMADLRGIWEPLLYTTTELGGQFPLIDASGMSLAKGEGTSAGVGANVGIGGGGSK